VLACVRACDAFGALATDLGQAQVSGLAGSAASGGDASDLKAGRGVGG
jgi:hypothetical protein